jgi:hypothetical protein
MGEKDKGKSLLLHLDIQAVFPRHSSSGRPFPLGNPQEAEIKFYFYCK